MKKNTSKQTVVLLDGGTLDYGDLSFDELKSTGALKVYSQTRPNQVAARIRGADQVVVNKCVLTGDVIKGAVGLKAVHVAATGVNNVDLEAAREAGIAVTNVAGYSTESVVQFTFAFLLALAGNLTHYDREIRKGGWSSSPFFMWPAFPVSEIHGKTLGIIGYGTIGRRVAQVGKAFGLSVLIARIPGRSYKSRDGRVSLEAVLKQSDFITIHAPLTPMTKGLIDEKELRKMKNSACLINMARGGIVDEKALLKALKAHWIAGAATDVLAAEPPQRTEPLLKAPNLLLTPHMAWASLESRRRLIHEVAENVKAFSAGRKRNRVV